MGPNIHQMLATIVGLTRHHVFWRVHILEAKSRQSAYWHANRQVRPSVMGFICHLSALRVWPGGINPSRGMPGLTFPCCPFSRVEQTVESVRLTMPSRFGSD